MENEPESGKEGICKVCGKRKRIDANRFCDGCYPYDDACDLYKRAKHRAWSGAHSGRGPR